MKIPDTALISINHCTHVVELTTAVSPSTHQATIRTCLPRQTYALPSRIYMPYVNPPSTKILHAMPHIPPSLQNSPLVPASATEPLIRPDLLDRQACLRGLLQAYARPWLFAGICSLAEKQTYSARSERDVTFLCEGGSRRDLRSIENCVPWHETKAVYRIAAELRYEDEHA
jgi:hypothetical protein